MSMSASDGIMIWIWSLRVVVVVNLALLFLFARQVAQDNQHLSAGESRYRRRLLWLSALFVVGCAFRSLLPRADVQRIALFAGWPSTVLIGRTVATVAEMAFMAQWALVLREGTPPGRRDLGWWVGRTLVPIIAVAEAFSWYAVLSTNFIGNVVEQSIWTVTSALVVAGAMTRSAPDWRPFAQTVAAMIVPYVLFMCVSDVPMYVRRWRADQARGHADLGLLDGFRDAATRVLLTRRWEPWHDEIAWMTLYFSAGVWISLWLVRGSPAPASVMSRDEQKSNSKFAS